MNNTLVGEKTIALNMAREILTSKVDIPAIPDHVRQIFEMGRQPEDKIDIPELARLVESDPGLFTRILQLANSPYYSEVEKIVTLRAAITRIGLKETINSVCLHFFIKILPSFPDIQGFSYQDFWGFSWACAVAGRRLGHSSLGHSETPGDLYMAGMLQGLGKLLFAMFYPEKFSTCLSQAQHHHSPLIEAERSVLGTTDGLVAAHVLEQWKMPENICQGVGFCQMPEKAPPKFKQIAGLVQFACAIATRSGIGASGDGIETDFSQTFLCRNTDLPITREKVQTELVKEILGDLTSKAQAMVPKARGVSLTNTGPAGARKLSTQRQALPREPPGGVWGWLRTLLGKK